MRYPRVMIAAPHGRSGKTTVTLGIVAALAARGLSVQAFKKGPDYIDPSWLTGASARPCRNLDIFMMGEGGVISTFRKGASGAEVSVIEGAMGFYDGLDLDGTGSSAAVARLLQTPVILVVDATRMTRSVAAMVSGYQHFEPGVNVAGVILNNVARARHETLLVGAIERYCGIPVLGAVPRRQDLAIPDRHLGLVPRAESESLAPAIEHARQAIEERVNLDLLLEIASSAGELDFTEGVASESSVISLLSSVTGLPEGVGRGPMPRYPGTGEDARAPGVEPFTQHSAPSTQDPTQSAVLSPQSSTRPPVRIGVLRDRVFTFYYPENLEALEAAGASLVYLDSLADRTLGDVDALYIGGGFPEVFMEELEANVPLRSEIRSRADGGMPIYAECAGLIYLSRRVRWGERSAEMVGVLPCEIEMTSKPQGHGYAIGEVVADNPFFPVGQTLHAHEFHNTRVSSLDGDSVRYSYALRKGSGVDQGRSDGLTVKNVLASYIHLHAEAAPGWAERFVEVARQHQTGRLAPA